MGKIIWIESAQNYPKYTSPRIWIGYKTESGKVTGIGMSFIAWVFLVALLWIILV
jgi:hypothetical protein